MPSSLPSTRLVAPIDSRLGAANNACMEPDALISFFGGVNATARALGVKPPSVSEWRAVGRVPHVRQYQVEVLTDGALRADRNGSHGASCKAGNTPALR